MSFHSQYANYNASFGHVEYAARIGTSYSNTLPVAVTAADGLAATAHLAAPFTAGVVASDGAAMLDVPLTPTTRILAVKNENRSF